jgi:hypothetical protein
MRATFDARAAAHELVRCARTGDAEGLLDTLWAVVSQSDPVGEHVRPVIAELNHVSVSAVHGRAAPVTAETLFGVELRDEKDQRLDVDELDPPTRAAVRALLAQLNGDPSDATFQLDLAVRDMDRASALTTVRQTLIMTVGLLGWSEA